MNFLLIRAGEWKKRNERVLEAPLTHPPLGLLYIGASLESDGHSVDILDYYAENISRDKLKNSLLSSDAVGICAYTKNYISAAEISKMIKEIDSDIPSIVGGPHCIFLQKRSLSTIPNADISVAGEGEHVIIDIVRFFQGRKNLSDIPGIYYRENTRIKLGKPLRVIDNLDSLPFPARHLVDKYDYGYFPWGYKLRKKVTSTVTSRGCPFRCRFCTRYGNVIKDWVFRTRSAENVVKEIQEIDKNYGSVFISDDNFLADVKRAHKIFDMLLENGTSVDLLIEGTRVDSAERTLYKKMKKAGVKFVGFGIESGNQDVLDFYNKKVKLQQIRKAIELAREMGFFTFGTFILGAPIETKEHIEKTIKFACSLPLDTADFGLLNYQMGSQLWVEAVRKKKISMDEYEVLADSSRGLGNFTLEELTEYTKKAFKRFYLRPSYLLNQIYRSLSRKDTSLLMNGLRFITSL